MFVAAGRLGWLGVIVIASSCATASSGGDDDDQPTVDAAATPDSPIFVAVDARSEPDAPPVIVYDATPQAVYDAAPGSPDASPPINADAPTGGVCTANQAITCGQTINGSLLTADNSVSGHSCSTLDTTLADDIYSFTAPGGTVSLNLNVIDDDIIFGDDFDLYVHQGVCDPAQCITHGESLGDESFSFSSVTNQLYYFVVEEYTQGLLTSMDYSLQVTCP